MLQPLKLETWPLSKLAPYARNPRKNDHAVDKMAASIKEFGFPTPCLVQSDGTVIDGHLRLKGAKKAGLESVPVIVCDGWTDAQVKAFRILANRSVEWATWDEKILADELIDIQDYVDLALTGFEDFELETLVAASDDTARLYQTEPVKLDDLKPHPRNYRKHPDDQLAHIIQSIKQHGFYRNVVIARDGTILAGHGLVAASRKMGKRGIQVVKLDIDPNSIDALKILAGDNDIQGRGEVDDRALTEILKDIRDSDPQGLLGSGYDDLMLANLLFVTRPASEIQDMDRAAAWAGMPEVGERPESFRIVISFQSHEDRDEFIKVKALDIQLKKSESAWTTWWPPKQNDDTSTVRFK